MHKNLSSKQATGPANGQPSVAAPIETLAVDARTITNAVFPNISLRTWRRLDSGGRCPRAYRVGARKLWRLADLRRWADWGFPIRADFEAKLRAEGRTAGDHAKL